MIFYRFEKFIFERKFTPGKSCMINLSVDGRWTKWMSWFLPGANVRGFVAGGEIIFATICHAHFAVNENCARWQRNFFS